MTQPRYVIAVVAAALVAGLGTADATAGRPHPPTSAVTLGSVTTVQQSTGEPWEQALRLTYHTGNDQWPDLLP